MHLLSSRRRFKRAQPGCDPLGGYEFNVDKLSYILGVFTLVTRSWAASEFLTHASKVNMTPNGEHQIIGLDHRLFDARVKILLPHHQCENPIQTIQVCPCSAKLGAPTYFGGSRGSETLALCIRPWNNPHRRHFPRRLRANVSVRNYGPETPWSKGRCISISCTDLHTCGLNDEHAGSTDGMNICIGFPSVCV